MSLEPAPAFMALEAACAVGNLATAHAALTALPAQDWAAGAALALHLGCPSVAAECSPEPLIRAAAWLRLGTPDKALEQLAQAPETARTAVLQARAALQQGGASALTLAEEARRQARMEGDAAALVASVTLLGELQRLHPFTALRTLAEGLKVAEMTAQPADSHLLAVLAHVQVQVGGGKGRRTAKKALERAAPGSPARVVALLALDRQEEALAEAARGQLAPVWWTAFHASARSGRPVAGQMGRPEADG
ncbi:hypothetical protein [Deinococcus navajonensis]|uniref:Uncharacterized protein n=1 Tax=Deinococcus navajonensis TaxID=309884 RepID=A0ABV8XUC6_9DEIO